MWVFVGRRKYTRWIWVAAVSTDFLSTYRTVLPVGRHVACGKDGGLTDHVERSWCTAGQRSGPFVRKTMSSSRSDSNRIEAFWHFVRHDNASRLSGHYRFLGYSSASQHLLVQDCEPRLQGETAKLNHNEFVDRATSGILEFLRTGYSSNHWKNVCRFYFTFTLHDLW